MTCSEINRGVMFNETFLSIMRSYNCLIVDLFLPKIGHTSHYPLEALICYYVYIRKI